MLSSDEWIDMGKHVGEVVAKKNAAYGDSFNKVIQIVQILYPSGVSYSQIPQLLFIIRILDKLGRIVNDQNFGGEDPALDIAGYAILMQALMKEMDKENV